MIKRVEGAIEKQQLFNEFVPVPQELTDTVAGSHSDSAEQSALEAQEKSNMEKYGYSNWYDFCCGEWGCKWDVDAELHMADEHSVDLSFDSAWAPPLAWYEKMTALGFEVDAYYYEPGMGFCGHYWDGNDEYYEIGATSEETRDQVPQDIDEMFCISENQYEWEQENRDELQAWIEDAVEAKDDQTKEA